MPSLVREANGLGSMSMSGCLRGPCRTVDHMFLACMISPKGDAAEIAQVPGTVPFTEDSQKGHFQDISSPNVSR